MIFTVDRFFYCLDLRKGIIGCGTIFGIGAVFLLAALQSLEIFTGIGGSSWSTFSFALRVMIKGGVATGIMEIVGSLILVYGVTERKEEPISFWHSSNIITFLLETILVTAFAIITGYVFMLLWALPVFLLKVYFMAAVYSYLKILKKCTEDKNIITQNQPPPSYTENI